MDIGSASSDGGNGSWASKPTRTIRVGILDNGSPRSPDRESNALASKAISETTEEGVLISKTKMIPHGALRFFFHLILWAVSSL